MGVEHNAKAGAVPFPFSLLPKLKDYSRNCNRKLEIIAKEQGIPLIANDDADEFSQIGTAYTIFKSDEIKMDSDEVIVRDLNKAIKEKRFSTHKGYLDFSKFLRYAVWRITFKDKLLNLREKYDSTHKNIN